MLKKILVTKTGNVFIQLFRYTFVGGLAYIVDFSSLFALTEYVGIHYLTSATIAFVFGITTNYSLSILWVFDGRMIKNKWLEAGIFMLIGVIGLCLNLLFMWILTEYIHFHYLLSKAVATVFVYMWNFFVRRYTLFRK